VLQPEIVKRLLILGGPLLALAILLALLLRPAARPAPVPSAPTVTCLGYTNDSSQRRFAILCIRNDTANRVACMAQAVEFQSEDGWHTNLLSRGPGQSWVNLNWRDFYEDFKPTESRVFWVPPPTTNGLWRLRFLCQEQAAGMQGLRDKASDLAENSKTLVGQGQFGSLTRFSGRRYEIAGPELHE